MISIHSKNLYLRPLIESDWDLFYSLYSNKDVMRLIAPPPEKDYLQEIFKKRLHIKYNELGDFYTLIIENKNKNKYMGICAYKLLDEEVAEMGVMLFPESQGKGVAEEASIALVNFCFEKLFVKTMSVQFDMENIRSIHVAKKIGFKFLKRYPHPFYPDDPNKHYCTYQLCPDDFKKN